EEGGADVPGPWFVAVSRSGQCLRGSLRAHRDPSTRSGRRFMRLAGGDQVLYVGVFADDANLACASKKSRALICPASEVALLGGPGKGVRLIKLDEEDELVGAKLLYKPSDMLTLEKASGVEVNVSTRNRNVVSRSSKGHP